MRLQKSLQDFWRGRRGGRGKQRRRSIRLNLEHLEHRLTPTTFNAVDVPSLIADINTANGNGLANTINLTAPTGIYTLTAQNNVTDGPTGLPVITSPHLLTINGNQCTIERSNAATPFRLFDVANGAALTLKNVRLENGLAKGNLSLIYSATGGAIYNQGTLTLNGASLANNKAQGSTPSTTMFATEQYAAGGGIWSSGGSLTLTGTTILEKDTAQAGGGPNGGSAFGGGIFANASKVSIGAGVIIQGCRAIGGAAGAYGGAGGSGYGGGLYATGDASTLISVSLTSATLQDDFAVGGHGRRGHIFGLTVVNGGKGGSGKGGALAVNDAALLLSGDRIQNNSAFGGSGGGESSAATSAVNGGAGGDASGGGLYASGGSVTDFNYLVVQSNTASGGFGGHGDKGKHGGAGGNGGNAFGGGLFTAGTTVKMYKSPLLQSNRAVGGFGGTGGAPTNFGTAGGTGGTGGNASGGALYATANTAVTLTLENATVQSNQASGGPGGGFLNPKAVGNGGNGGNDFGGGLWLGQNALLLNDVLKANSAGGSFDSGGEGRSGGQPGTGGISEGGALFVNAGTITLGSSVIDNNFAAGGNGGTVFSSATVIAGTGGEGRGGGVAVAGGNLTVKNCSLVSNAAYGGFGGIHEALVSGGSRWSNGPPGTGGNARGGALYVAGGAITLSSSAIDNNTANGGGGGNSYNNAAMPSGMGGSAFGGGVAVAGGTVTVQSSSLLSNLARGGNGGYHLQFLNPNPATNGFWTLTAGTAAAHGAGGAGYGGGLYISGGTLHLTLDDVETNQANGGSTEGKTESTAASGGGLYLAGGTTTVDAFTSLHIVNNTDSNNDTHNNIGP